jgi:hypothetical protein
MFWWLMFAAWYDRNCGSAAMLRLFEIEERPLLAMGTSLAYARSDTAEDLLAAIIVATT